MDNATYCCALGARPTTIGELKKLISAIPDDRRIFNDCSDPPAVTIHYATDSTVLFVDIGGEENERI